MAFRQVGEKIKTKSVFDNKMCQNNSKLRFRE